MAGKIELHDPAHPTFKERQKKAAADKAAAEVKAPEKPSETKTETKK